MKKKVSKILKLNFIESFLQINYLKGFKYIDKAGELVNYFYEDKKEPPFEMNLGGLTILKPKNKAEEIRITPKSFWAHFINPNSFEEVEDFFKKETEGIVKILEIKEITRIGWRNYFVYDFENEEEAKSVIEKFSPIGELKPKELFFDYEYKKFLLNIRLKKVLKNDEDKKPGILIDIDFYKKFTESTLPTDDVSRELTKMKNAIKEDVFLEFINKILQ